MKDEYKLKQLEDRINEISENFDILQDSINRLPAIILICFLLGTIVGFLL